MESKYSMPVRVTSYDVGASRTLKPSSILKLMQETAGRHLDGAGLTYEAMRSKGVVFLIVKMAVDIISLPKYDDEITVETRFERTEGVKFVRSFRFFDGTGNPLIGASTFWIIADPDTHRILRPSAFPFERPEGLNGGFPIDFAKITLPDTASDAGVRRVRWSDIDCNSHMNNAVYADIVCDFFPGGLGKRQLRHFQIDFEGEAVLGDEINIKTAVNDDGAALFEGTIGGRRCFKALAY